MEGELDDSQNLRLPIRKTLPRRDRKRFWSELEWEIYLQMLIEINCAKTLRKGNVFLDVNSLLVKECAFILFWAFSK